MKKIIYGIFCAVIVLSIAACSSNRVVKRVDTGTTMDLSGRWNDSDSRMVAETMVKDLFGARWLPVFETRHNNQRPVIVVGTVLNKSHEHIDAETFVKDIERAIVNNGSIRLVQGGAKREELRSEREQQNQGYVSPETVKKWGRELGADVILQGTINSIVDSYKKNKIVYYQVDMELTDLETNEVIWIGSEKIKKTVSNRF